MTGDCQLPCDADCEIGPVHCWNYHRPNHKPDWHDPAECGQANEDWVASDGSHWFYYPPWDEWTGWMPHEDGHWQLTDTEFRDAHPEAPCPRGCRDRTPWSAACPCGWTGGPYPDREAVDDAINDHRLRDCPGRTITGEVMF